MSILIAAALVQAVAPQLDAIEMDMKSWGRPVSSWTIDAAGNGRYAKAEPSPHAAERIVTRSFAAGTKGFARLRVLLGEPEQRAGAQLACQRRITDMPYGEVTWRPRAGRSYALRYDTGCQDFAARRLLRRIGEAEALVAGWAAAGPVIETRKVEGL